VSVSTDGNVILTSAAVTHGSVCQRCSVAPCGLRVVRIDPLRFLAGCRTRRLNQV